MGETHRGYLEIGRTWDDFLKWAEDYRVGLQEVADLGADQVFVVVTLTGKTKEGGILMDARFFDVLTLQKGSIVRIEEYTDRAEALEAAGLRE